MVSELSFNDTYPHFGRTTSKETRIAMSTTFSEHYPCQMSQMVQNRQLLSIGVTYYPNPVVRPYLESCHQGEPFRPQIESGMTTLFIWFLLVFSKLNLLCANQKSSF